MNSSEDFDFYEKASTLDAIRESSNPNEQVVRVLGGLLKNSANAKYFFNGLADPRWVSRLNRIGAFQDCLEYAIDYLVRVASLVPEEVVDIVQGTSTDSWYIQRNLLSALQRMPASFITSTIPKIREWLTSDSSSEFLVTKAIGIMEQLSIGEEHDAALLLLEVLTEPIRQEQKIEGISIPREPSTRYNIYWLNRVLAGAATLIQARPLETVKLLRAQLEIANQHYEGYSGWRHAVEDHSQNRDWGDYLDTLFAAIRDLMAEQIKLSSAAFVEMATGDLNHELTIFRRLAIHLANHFPDQLPQSIDSIVSTPHYLNDLNLYHEYMLFLRNQFGTLSPERQDQIIGWIVAGDHSIENEELRHHWKQRLLFNIREHLPISLLEEIKDFRDFIDGPDAGLFLSYHGSFMKVVSPKQPDELASMSDEALLDYLRTYEETRFHGRVELSWAFGQCVAQSPSRFLSIAPSFLAVDWLYVEEFINGLQSAWKSDRTFNWVQTLAFCEMILDQYQSEPGEKRGVRRAIANLIKAGVEKDDHALPHDLLERVKQILIRILQSKEHPEDLAWSLREDADPVSTALNTEHPRALEALLSYALHRSRTQLAPPIEGTGPFPQGNRLEPDVQQILTHLLDESSEPNPSLRAWYGVYLPQLRYLNQEWLDSVLVLIFPEAQQSNRFWQAAWDGYLFGADRIYKDLFWLIRQQYERAIDNLALSSDFDKSSATHLGTDRRLTEHIAILYLWQFERLSDSDSLIRRFLDKAPHSDCASMAFFFSNQFYPYEEEIWGLLKEYWAFRTGVFAGADFSRDFQDEAQNFVLWLKHVRETLETIYPLVESIVRVGGEVWAGVQDVLEFLERQVENYPERCGSILRTLVEQHGGNLNLVDHGQIEHILTVMAKDRNAEAYKSAQFIINRFGEIGNYRYRGLLYD